MWPVYCRAHEQILARHDVGRRALFALAGCQRDADAAPETRPAATSVPAEAAQHKASTLQISDAASAGQLPVLEIQSEGGELRDGVLTVDAYEGDRLWMGVILGTEAGTPLADETVTFSPLGNELSPPPQVIAAQPETDADGYMEFQIIVGDAGTFPVTVSAAGVRREFRINVIPNDFDQWLQGVSREGLLPWNAMMKTRVTLDDDDQMVAEFPDDISRLDGTVVRLAGFMLPLEMTAEQGHFLLSASPPACFFHVPGGPATVVEVFADQHPVTASFDPLVIEGRLELVKRSERGILFALREARNREKSPVEQN